MEPEDSSALAKAIQRLESDPASRRRMGAAGRAYVISKLSRERTAQTYISVLENLKKN